MRDKTLRLKDIFEGDGWIYENGTRRRPSLDGALRLRDFDLNYRSPDWLSENASRRTLRGVPEIAAISRATDYKLGVFGNAITNEPTIKPFIDANKTADNYSKYIRKHYADFHKYKLKNGHWKVDNDFFDPAILNTRIKSNLIFLINKINYDSSITDIRWVAYILATVWLETGRTFSPIKEKKGKNSYQKYWEPYPTSSSPIYYGRGYIQLTWYYNYKKFDKFIPTLFENPDLTLNDRNVAYKILSIAMTQGLCTNGKHKLIDYINRSKCDYLNARRIVNGNNRDILVADVASTFEKLIRECSK